MGDEVNKLIEKRRSQMAGRPQRASVSAEAYGMFNKKGDFKARVIEKTDDQRKRILDRVMQSFLFNSLEERDLETVLLAFEEKRFNKGDHVIDQGDHGDVLFLIESGTLNCYKV